MIDDNLITHLHELKKCVIKSIVAYLVVAIPAIYFCHDIFNFILEVILSKKITMLSTEIITTFTVPLKLSLIISAFLCMPYFFWQIWCFVSPALFKAEKKLIVPLTLLSIGLFYLGSMLAIFIVIPITITFFSSFALENVAFMPDIKHLLNFILTLWFTFGLVFQTPLISFLLFRFNIINYQTHKNIRPYIIIGAFTLGMLLTPPDVISQIMLAIPMWGLFELGLLLAYLFKPEPKEISIK